MKNNYFDLPVIITLEEYGGNFNDYLEAVYKVFKNDFVYNKPSFRGTKLGLKKIPNFQGKEATFWHMTSDGDEEENRIPDLRRMERIAWPSPMMNDSEHPYLKVWRNQRNGKDRILIFHEDEEYLVILADRGTYILPWTAYLVPQEHSKRKLIKEYEAYIKANAAQ